MLVWQLPRCVQGYKRFGIQRENGVTTYREWAPAAQAAWLIGDFNEWEGTPLDKDEFGTLQRWALLQVDHQRDM